ncbi:extended synaptotagmin-3 [Rhinophrynus dorsalis]
MRRFQLKKDPQIPERSPGDPQHRNQAHGDPKHRNFSSSDQQQRYLSPGDPRHGSLSSSDPQYRNLSPSDPQYRHLSPGDPRHRSLSSSDPQYRNLSSSDPQQRHLSLGDPQHRHFSPRDLEPGTLAPGDPQKRTTSPGYPQSRSMAPGDPQSNDMQQSDPKPGGLPPGDPPPGEPAPDNPLLALLRGLVRPLLRALLCLFPVYVCGRLRLSLSWLLLGLLLWIFWQRNKSSKLARMRAFRDLLEDEYLSVTRGLNLQQLPAWVNFPDVERVEWVNKVIGQMWPYFGMYMERLFQEKIEPMVRSSNVHLKAFTFTKVHFGEKAPRVNGIKAYTKEVDKREVILDIQLCYNGDCEINVEVKKMCNAGVKGIQVYGTLRVILAPLISSKPFVGAVTMFFIQKPHLDINWTGLTNVLEIPGVNDMSDSMIIDIIASHLVLPNRFTFPLCGFVNAAQLRFPLPRLYTLVIGLEGVMKDRVVDEWFPLSDVASGLVHLRLEWFSLIAQQDKLSEAQNGLSTAIVIVYLDNACNLPKNQFEYSNNEYTVRKQRYPNYTKVNKEPCSYVLMSVGAKKVKSKTCSNSADPVWEQAFAFFIQDVHMQHLQLQVKDDDRQCALGTLDLALHRLLSSEEMTVDQRFPLANSGPNSTIKMKLVLRVLHIEEPEPDSVYAGINSLKHGPVSIKRMQDQKPQKKSHKHPDVQQAQQIHSVPQSRPARKESSGSAQRMDHTGTEQTLEPNHSSSGNSSAPTGTDSAPTGTGLVPTGTNSAPRTPNLRTLKKFAPSLISLNSVASTCFDANDGHSWPEVMSGEIQITVRYASLRRCLIVEINSCRNLIHCSTSGADPYVRIYLLPDRRWSSRKRTTVKRKTVNPQYEERFDFLVPLEEVKRRTLDVAVKNNRSFVSQQRKELGKVLVDLSQGDLVQGFTRWFELTPTGHPIS